MFVDLIGLLGTTVGGKIFGDVGRIVTGWSDNAEQREVRLHEERLAEKKVLHEYLEKRYSAPAGQESSMARVCSFLLLFFGVCYGVAALSLFLWEPTQNMLSKDPANDGRVIEFGFGLIKYDIANNRVVSMARAGFGYLMLYPFVFLFSVCITGEKPQR